LGRSHFDELIDKEEKERLSDLNSKKLAGDPEIIWDMGGELRILLFLIFIIVHREKIIPSVCINPAFHGKGIASAAIGTLLQKWAIPHMAVHQIVACSFASNIASSKAFLKNGFTIDSELSGSTVKQEMEKGGAEEKQIVVRWVG
jgi:RimJ/RimL family protein N-acetyltransferase